MPRICCGLPASSRQSSAWHCLSFPDPSLPFPSWCITTFLFLIHHCISFHDPSLPFPSQPGIVPFPTLHHLSQSIITFPFPAWPCPFLCPGDGGWRAQLGRCQRIEEHSRSGCPWECAGEDRAGQLLQGLGHWDMGTCHTSCRDRDWASCPDTPGSSLAALRHLLCADNFN